MENTIRKSSLKSILSGRHARVGGHPLPDSKMDSRVRGNDQPKRRYRLLVFSMLVAVAQSACVTPMGMAASNVPVSPEQIDKTIGPAEGTSSTWSFSPLCLFSFGHPDFDEAIHTALEASQGDVLVDIRWYKKNACLLVATWDKLYLSGTAVKLKPKGDFEGKRRK